ncbi:MAG: hypothetical protein JNL28_14775 [Planctomycetes bacterium]|nr:hypothetical protein [Planctomycetota bacterium]
MPIESQTDVLTWVASLTAVLAAAIATAAWLVVARAKHIEERLKRLERIDELTDLVKGLSQGDEALDVRRLEHVLIDIRDGQKRVEERMFALLEARAKADISPTSAGGGRALERAGTDGLPDRIVTRLVALGYERIVLVTANEEIARIAREGGAVVIEARRNGAACKGRAIIANGTIQDIEIQSAYSTFP